MDSYPQDLLVGVFPLVFAVNAILPSQDLVEGRSLFERFLDVVVASLVEAEDDSTAAASDPLSLKSASTHSQSYDSDDEFLESISGVPSGGGVNRRRSSQSGFTAGFYAGWGRRSLTLAGQNASSHESAAANPSASASYAKALTHGQGFFQRARIESVSPRHGFPPSKCPEGRRSGDRRSSSSPPLDPRDSDLLRSLEGILPVGWLEKHVHALPSVLVVVCVVTASQQLQAAQDRLLFETVRHFRSSLVAKRHCKIHVVGLLNDAVSPSQGDEWNRAVSAQLHEDDANSSYDGLSLGSSSLQSHDAGTAPASVRITLLRSSSDLQSSDTGRPSSLAFRRLHQSVRDASLTYYHSQAKRTKKKLAAFFPSTNNTNHATATTTTTSQSSSNNNNTAATATAGSNSPPAPLLPLVIRYCFKIAIFYEFQYQFEKSLRYFAEAYRHATKYYEYLLLQDGDDPDPADGEAAAGGSHATAVHDTGESLEVAFLPPAGDRPPPWEAVVPQPRDRLHQCQAVAEWLNLKLLQAGFSSHTEGGLLAAAHQWRQHHAGFASVRRLPALFRQHSRHPLLQPWYQWQYIARQRLVLSQLVERHPPKALGDLGNDYDEVLLRCSPWRTYESAAEATLQLARAVDRASQSPLVAADDDVYGRNPHNDPMRPPYVGGQDSESLRLELKSLRQRNHRAAALDLVLRAISLYERELEKEKRGFYAEDTFRERSSSRAGARLYYLAGGILLGMERHEEAIQHLEKASRFCKGWPELELAVRRMSIECYEKHLPASSSPSDESNQAIASMILDSYFNAEMSSSDLRRALGQFASIKGGGKLTWHHEILDEEDTSLPVSFAVSFPGRTHATAGEAVKASVLITSNLDYAIHVNSVVLLSLAGKLPIPSMDLSSAVNASEGSEGGIIIQSKTSIMISTELELPTDTSIIAIDDSGNGGEIQGVAGKGSFAKSARPRTAGITAAGGARLVSEEELAAGNRVSQGWNLKCLGGKPLRCDGICVEFYPVQVEKSTGSAEEVTPIELTIEKKKSKTQANIKRTPFEEENYLASAWSRPLHFPLSLGPRSLRVLGPMPDMVIKDLTEEATGGKVLEGTVNRVLLKLTSGLDERCCDIQYCVTCFSVLMTPNGSIRRLVPEGELSQSETSLNMTNPVFRTPTLVSPSAVAGAASRTECGYTLPPGWQLAGSGQAFTGPVIPSLSCGESKYIALDFFRPAPLIQTLPHNIEGDLDVEESSMCKTDFYFTVTYRQERSLIPKGRRTSKRRSVVRRLPVMNAASKDSNATLVDGAEESELSQKKPVEPTFDEVSLEFTGSMVWAMPLSAFFRPGATQSFPSECRDPLSPSTKTSLAPGERLNDAVRLVDCESVTMNCTLQADNAVEGLKTEVLGVRYERVDESNVTVSLASASANGASETLYEPHLDNPCRLLSAGSKLSIAYTVKPCLKDPTTLAKVKASLGNVVVDWKSSPLPLPEDAKKDLAFLHGVASHGPLRLDSPSALKFSGPECCIEAPPLRVSMKEKPSTPRIGVPFQLAYTISNETQLHQALSVCVMDAESGASSGLMFAGLAQGELTLAPSESQLFSYTMLGTKAGKTKLPGIEIVSRRDSSLILKEPSREIYVLP